MAVPFWLLAQGAQIGMNYFAGKAKQDKMRDLGKITPEERDYVKRQRDIAKSGDPYLQDKMGRQVGAIRQEGQFQRQRQFGTLARQGMENSIVADELRRRTDKGVMQQISEESGKIAEQNRQAKLQAQGKVDQFQLNRATMLRNLASQTPTNTELALGVGQSAVGMGLDILGNAQWTPGVDGGEGSWKFPSMVTGQVEGGGTFSNDWMNPANEGVFSGMIKDGVVDEDAIARYLKSLKGIDKEKFMQWFQENYGD